MLESPQADTQAVPALSWLQLTAPGACKRICWADHYCCAQEGGECYVDCCTRFIQPDEMLHKARSDRSSCNQVTMPNNAHSGRGSKTVLCMCMVSWCMCVCVPARACPRGYKQVYVGRQWMGMCAAPVQIAHPQLILLLLQLRSCAVQAATRVPCCCQLLRQAGDLRCRLLPACLCCPRCCCCFVLCLDGPLSSVLAGFGPLACIRPAAMISMPTATSRSG